jgi:hypothetical protein
MSDLLKRQFSTAVEEFNPMIDFVASRLGSRDVANLERLATAIYVTLEGTPAESRAKRINELKKHVSLTQAESAIGEADQLIQDARAQFPAHANAH